MNRNFKILINDVIAAMDHLFICLYHNLWKVGPVYNYPYPTNGMGKGSIEKAHRYSDCFGSDGNGPDICSSNCT